ncbi:MAG: hypothetical protein H7Z14_09315 [Anaerolineae bacterium]|nr:hypothetical protein [Phycisphaerae bacterium]
MNTTISATNSQLPLEAVQHQRTPLSRDTLVILGFLVGEIIAQIALLSPSADAIRIPLRAFPFAGSIAMLFLTGRRHQLRLHPASTMLLMAVIIVAFGILHPERNTIKATLATLGMYAAIALPVIWVCQLRIDETLLRRIILVFWSFNVASALVGVGQTLQPDWQWLQPNLSLVVQNFNDGGEGLKISLANGARVFRPMGLSDQPGGAAMSGLVSIVFGMALFLSTRNIWLKVAVIIAWGLGLYCILLSQVRSVLVMTGVCVIAFAFVMARRGEFSRLVGVLLWLGAAVAVAGTAAVVVGGETVTSRLMTLVEEDPTTVYMSNRGFFMEYTIRYAIPKYPVGAGPGRWGMMNYYFGTQDDPESEPLWSEVNWTAWTYDGGIPLLITYVGAIGIALWQAWKIGRDRTNGTMGQWGAVMFAYNIGCLAVTFNCNLFMGQSGLDFWLLNAAMFAAAERQRAMRTQLAPPREIQPDPVSGPRSLLGMNT